MNIKIDIEELKHILAHTPCEQNIMLTGRHGIGKSEILNEYFSQKGMKVIALFLGQMSDPGDLIGLPDKSGEKTVFRPPYWFPIDGKPIVLFLDELNRARPEVLQTIMDLTLNRKLAGRELPKGSRVIAAVNEGEEYQLTDLDPALVSRFNIFQFEPTVEEWILWARKNNLDNRVINFIQSNVSWLDKDPNMEESADIGLDKTPDRRAWKRVSDVIVSKTDVDELDLKLISGIIGVKAARLFANKMNQKKLVEAKKLLSNFDAQLPNLKKMRLHEYQRLNEDIMAYLTIGKSITRNKTKISGNIAKYINFLEAQEKGEVIASFASLLQQRVYAQASDFISKNCDEVFRKAFTYTSSIR